MRGEIEEKNQKKIIKKIKRIRTQLDIQKNKRISLYFNKEKIEKKKEEKKRFT